jgi:hypothetical protein
MKPPGKHDCHPASYYRDHAKRARDKAAAAIHDTDMNRSWLSIAEQFDALAETAEEATTTEPERVGAAES